MTSYSRSNPSPTYKELLRVYADVHVGGLPEVRESELFDGISLYPHISDIGELARKTGSRSILDFGSGKGRLYRERRFDLADGTRIDTVQGHWQVNEIVCYDPGVAEFSAYPQRRFDGVVCTDVLEHIPEDDIDWFLRDLFALAEKFVFANIASYPAIKTLPNGWNAHVTIKPHDWWRERIRKAATGWRGEIYHFQVKEKSKGFDKLTRKLTGRSKYDLIVIEERPSRAA
jgi:hypothetical protein